MNKNTNYGNDNNQPTIENGYRNDILLYSVPMSYRWIRNNIISK
jgi:hypothetical protein